jgi:ABC-type Zn uptake system ZnuABC Zn-binding protein ZnuA
MKNRKTRWLLHLAGVIAAASGIAAGAAPSDRERLSVAVVEPDIEAIVLAVGGNQVDTFSLFKGCILRKNLLVEPTMKVRLAKASAVVWTGFLNESAAINASLGNRQNASKATAPAWIDVSKGAVRVNVPTSTCFGYVDASSMSGDPFFWLNPENGSIIARNVAEGLGSLQPEKRAYFLANANAFKEALHKDIARWKMELKPLVNLRVFSAQCGWQNFSRLGGPSFVVCKGTPGELPSPKLLLDRVKRMKPQLIIVDPNTPSEYGTAFREQSGLSVIEVASSIEHIPGAKSYNALFENMVRTLLRNAETLKHSAKN